MTRRLPCPHCKKLIDVSPAAPTLPRMCPFCYRSTVPAPLDFAVIDQVLGDMDVAAAAAVPILDATAKPLDPNQANALNRQGMAAVGRGSFAEAIALFTEALR